MINIKFLPKDLLYKIYSYLDDSYEIFDWIEKEIEKENGLLEYLSLNPRSINYLDKNINKIKRENWINIVKNPNSGELIKKHIDLIPIDYLFDYMNSKYGIYLLNHFYKGKIFMQPYYIQSLVPYHTPYEIFEFQSHYYFYQILLRVFVIYVFLYSLYSIVNSNIFVQISTILLILLENNQKYIEIIQKSFNLFTLFYSVILYFILSYPIIFSYFMVYILFILLFDITDIYFYYIEPLLIYEIEQQIPNYWLLFMKTNNISKYLDYYSEKMNKKCYEELSSNIYSISYFRKNNNYKNIDWTKFVTIEHLYVRKILQKFNKLNFNEINYHHFDLETKYKMLSNSYLYDLIIDDIEWSQYKGYMLSKNKNPNVIKYFIGKEEYIDWKELAIHNKNINYLMQNIEKINIKYLCQNPKIFYCK